MQAWSVVHRLPFPSWPSQHVLKWGFAKKRVLLDIADIRQCVDNNSVRVSWMPTQCMLSDVLIKYMPNPQTLCLYLKFNMLVADGGLLGEESGLQKLSQSAPTTPS
eukprot:6489741-Amphidinium_carterae.3